MAKCLAKKMKWTHVVNGYIDKDGEKWVLYAINIIV